MLFQHVENGVKDKQSEKKRKKTTHTRIIYITNEKEQGKWNKLEDGTLDEEEEEKEREGEEIKREEENSRQLHSERQNNGIH